MLPSSPFLTSNPNHNMISKYNFLAAAKTSQGATLLVLVTNKQLNVSRTHASAVERHSTLSIFGRRKPNVGLSSRPPVIAVGQDDGVQDWIVANEELENIFFCSAKWKTAHTQKASVLTDLDAAKAADAAVKAKDFASEKFAQASDKFKELSNKEQKELIEEAKEFARQKPAQALVVSAAVGLILGLLLKRK